MVLFVNLGLCHYPPSSIGLSFWFPLWASERTSTTNIPRTLLTQLQLFVLPTIVCHCYHGGAQRRGVQAEDRSLSVSPEQEEPTFGAWLRRLRESAGLTQEELAFRAGLTPNGVSALERGQRKRPYPHTVRSLAEALGLSELERATLLAAVPGRAQRPLRSKLR